MTGRRSDALAGAVAEYFMTGGLALVLQPMADEVETLVNASPARCGTLADVNWRLSVIDDRVAYTQRVNRVVRRAHVVKVSTDVVRGTT